MTIVTPLSPGVIAALRKGLEAEERRRRPQPADADQVPDQVLEAARQRVALLGPFDPETIGGDLPSDLRSKVRQALAAESEDVSDERHRRWMLKSAPRRLALESLRRSDKLGDALEQVTPGPGDPFGQCLHRVLRGERPALHELSTSDLHQVNRASEFAVLAAPDRGTDLIDIRQELGRRALDEELASVLPDGLIGRDQELSRLRTFLQAPPTDDLASHPIVVTGIGGSGKSTLVAAFVRELRSAPPPVPVILLDFDRPLVTPESVDLSRELARQLAVELPLLATELTALASASARRLRVGFVESSANQSNVSQGALGRADLVTLSELGRIADGGGILNEPLVVVLDTFEEVVIQGASAVASVRSWLGSLSTVAGFRHLRPIVSGRSGLRDLTALDTGWAGEELVVGDLEPKDAATLLVARGVDAADAAVLAAKFGGNPLLLRLLADFRRHDPDITVAELVRSGKRQTRGGDWQIAYLYNRILKHVRDREVGQMAHPGLVLRRVTAPLIAEVLARPCGLGKIDEVRANDLFRRLASHVWLVERRTGRPDEVFHRRDLRRLMLSLVRAAQPAKTAEIHRRAVRYYRRVASAAGRRSSGDSPGLSTLDASIEALYHGLMLDPREMPSIADDMAKEFRFRIGGEIDDLPRRPRALLKAKSGARLTAEEIRALPRGQRASPAQLEIDHISDPVAAAAFAAEALGARWTTVLRPSKAIHLLHATGDLAGVARFGRYLHDPVAHAEAGEVIQSGGEAVECAIWLVSVFRRLLVTPPSVRRSPDPVSTVDELALLEGLRLLGTRSLARRVREVSLPPGSANLDSLARLSLSRPGSTILLRHAMLAGRPLPATVRLSKLRLLDPTLPGRFDRIFPRARTQLVGVSRDELARQIAFLTDRRNELTLGQVDDAIARWTDAGLALSSGPGTPTSTVLRGMTPEFQAPVCTALAEAMTSPASARALARAVWRIVPVRPLELHPDRRGPALFENPRQWLGPVVDLCDRGARLGKLLEAACRIAPQARKLRTVARAYRRWDHLLWTCWKRGS